jgi:nitroimidazol reductase NimA-like FMN-containing flavoprotein (pyridoxamine 5'-phosphate oxidase superfamily)
LDDRPQITKQIKELFLTQNLAVLATQNKGNPYTNLVSFASSDNLKQIFFVTPQYTRKYMNLSADSRVSILVDNRSNKASDIGNAIAVTAIGDAEEIKVNEKDEVLLIYLAKHPYMEDFAKSPTSALLRINVRKYIIVSRFQKVLELEVSR